MFAGELVAASCRLVTNPNELPDTVDAWADLVTDSQTNYPTCAPHWQLPWWEVLAPVQQRALFLLCVESKRGLIGIAPFTRRRVRYHGSLSINRLELFGCGEAEADMVCSCYSGIVARRGREEEVAEALAEFLFQSSDWDELCVPEAANSDRVCPMLEQQLRWRGLHTRLTSPQSAYAIDLPDTWDSYVKSLSKKGRYLVRRSGRDYQRWVGDTERIHHADTSDDLAHAYHVLQQLNRERWADDGGAVKSDAFDAFHLAMLPRLAEQGGARISWIEGHGKPLAALYQILWDGSCYAYQAGRTLSTPKEIRPGIVLHTYAIRWAIERGDRTYDMLCGSSRYKMELGASPRPLIGFHAWKPSLRVHLCIVADEALAFLRGVRRRKRERDRCTDPA